MQQQTENKQVLILRLSGDNKKNYKNVYFYKHFYLIEHFMALLKGLNS